MQKPAIQWAKEQGWTVFVADDNENAEYRHLADSFVHVDLADIEGMISAARRIKTDHGLDGVFTAGTDFSYTVARVARSLGLPGLEPETALAASNKERMRRVFRENGIPSPSFRVLSSQDEPRKVLSGLDFPLVVKPVDNMGARGIRRIDSEAEFLEAFRLAGEHSRSGQIIVEQYVPGPEFSIDALVVDGEPRITGIADRHIFFPPYFVEMGHTMPTEYSGRVLQLVEESFTAAVKALGIDKGAAKGDVKWDGRRAVIGEVAARLSGGYMSGWTYPYASGVPLTGRALELAVGKPPGSLEQRKSWVSAERAFISIPGVVDRVEGLREAAGIAGVRDVFVRVKQGDPVSFPTNNVEKCGNCISAAAERHAAVNAAEEACRKILVRLRPGETRTADFLRGETCQWVPAAYPQAMAWAKEYVERMPEFRELNGSPTGPRRITVLPPPSWLELEERDWHGLSVADALAVLEKEPGIRLSEESKNSDILVGSLFWRHFLRAGIQAGLWIVDTMSRFGGEYFRQW